MRPICIYLVILISNSILSSAINSSNYSSLDQNQIFLLDDVNSTQSKNNGSNQLKSQNPPNQNHGLQYWPLVGKNLEKLRYKRGPTTTSTSTTTTTESPFLDDESGFFTDFTDTFNETPTPPPLYHIEYSTAYVNGMRIEAAVKEPSYGRYGVADILADEAVEIRLFGNKFSNRTIVRFLTEMKTRGDGCDDTSSTKTFTISKISLNSVSAIVQATFKKSNPDEFYYICVRDNHIDRPWVHQGPDAWLMIHAQERFLPFWLQTILICVLLMLSGLFAGLTLGLLSLDTTSLKIIANTGEDKQRVYARTILPLRARGNFLLCSLVLGNVFVNSTLTIILDDLTTGLVAVTLSTFGIVIFGEIIPQAVCSRHGLAVGTRTVWLTKLMMVLTFPLSYPCSVILDKILGEEIGNVYNRKRLVELIKVTEHYNDLEKDEVNVIEGVLKLSQSTCADVMTKIDDVYMLPLESTLDFDTISEIMASGFSRIPVYEGTRGNVVSLLYTKDLAFVDPDDRLPLRTICEFYHFPCNFVEDVKPLDEMFREFKDGNKGHMAFVKRIHLSDNEDPYYEIIGVVTLEDVIEELIQAEINDETDVLESNRSIRKRTKGPMNIMQGMMARSKRSDGVIISPHLALAAYQYLSTSIPAFCSDEISKSILDRLLKQYVFVKIKFKSKDDGSAHPSMIIYERGKASDYFVLILEGRVSAEMGREGLIFESGPFHYFGTQSLSPSTGNAEITTALVETRKFGVPVIPEGTFIPDYTVKAITDVVFLKISRSMYSAAKQATILEKSYSGHDNQQNKAGEDFDTQMGIIINGKSEERITVPDYEIPDVVSDEIR